MALASVVDFVKSAPALQSPPPFLVEAPALIRADVCEPEGWRQQERIQAPPMIGPLATPEMAMRSPPPPEPRAAELPEAAKPEAGQATEPDAPRRDPAEFELERCAAISASLALRREEATTVLKENGLSAEEWNAIERYWAGTVREETARGKTSLLKRFDKAYVERLERERGPIKVQDYAKLLVASERATADAGLEKLGLPQGALIRVQRVWLEMRIRDDSLDQQIRDAVDKIRATE
jgi:hypothetical protein